MLLEETLTKALQTTLYAHREMSLRGAEVQIENGALAMFGMQGWDILLALYTADMSEALSRKDKRNLAIILAAIAAALAARVSRDVQAMSPGILAALQAAVINAGLAKYGITGDIRQIQAQTYLLEHGGELVTGLNQFTKERLSKMLAKAFASGDSFDVIANRIMSAYDEMTYARALKIAKTEASKAWSFAEMESAGLMEQAGFVMVKEWLLGPMHPRYDICDHNNEAGAIPLHQPFPSGDMATPQHPSCGCSIITYPAAGQPQPWGSTLPGGLLPYPPGFDQGDRNAI
jgi:hypothetical protein